MHKKTLAVMLGILMMSMLSCLGGSDNATPPAHANADLAGLGISQGTLNPVFSAATTSYTVVVANGVAAVTITPTVAGTTATVKVNNVSVASGATSGAIALSVGVNAITILVTAGDGTTTKTYNVTVTRQAGSGGDPVNTANPAATVKLMFIHHSTGWGWLEDGNLGAGLNASNFYVTEAYYTWESDALPPGCTAKSPIGDYTDTPDWPCWFNDTTMPSVYTNTAHYAYPTNTMANPAGENAIIMFKSCFPNSEVGDDITDEQAIYNGLLTYFAAHTDKMFVLIVPPPMLTISNPAKTRELANWLADRTNGWLKNYSGKNVYAFDYYNVLTHPDNHHYVSNGYETHVVANSQNTLYYPSGSSPNFDDHPSAAGQQKATAEFVPLLKAWYNEWKGN